MKHQDKQVIETTIAYVLRAGLCLSLLTAIYGGILLLYSNGLNAYDYTVFKGEPTELIHLKPLFAKLLENSPQAFIMLSLVILIATPFMRVLSCLIIFILEKDRLYIFLATVVLSVLTKSLFF